MKKYLFLLLIVCAGKFASPQTAATNTGILYITGSSDIFHASSDFTNNSGSALTNNGQLYVRGNLSNAQSSMAIGTGTLFLNGTSAQAVNGSQPFKTFNLNTNNTTGITLNNNLSVSGLHTFSNGVIATSATPNYLIYEAGSSYTGDGDTKHVNGWIKKFGSTNFIFPVGNGTVERTVALNSLSASSEFNVKYLPTTPNPNSMVSPVWDVDEPEYWTINKISGGNATVTLNWNYSKVYFPNWVVADILVAGYNGSAWTDNGGAGTASGLAATTGTVTSSSISTFNLFTFGSRTYVLPLTLISFNAARQDNYTQITWKTENEYSTDRFVVERSDDGISFYTLSQVPARNLIVSQQYEAKDYATINRVAYYRLRTIDANGRESLSKTVAVNVTNDSRLTVLTNPVHDKITLVANAALSGTFNYTITAMNGKMMQQGSLPVQNGGQYPIALKSDISAGIYMLDVRDGQKSFRFKIAVK